MANQVDIAHKILNCSRSLIIYRDLRELKIWKTMEEMLKDITERELSSEKWLENYYEFIHLLFSDSSISGNTQLSWSEWVLHKVFCSENPFSLACERRNQKLGTELTRAVEHDLDCIREVGNIPWEELIRFVAEKEGPYGPYKPVGFTNQANWDDFVRQKGLNEWSVEALARYYKRYGAGIFNKYRGLYWNGTALKGIKNVDPVTLEQLVGYDTQREILIENTYKFVRGYPANNVLLYGDKGTGKSSMVKALLHKFGNEGLRIVEIPKVYMKDYNKVMDKLENRGFRFILFIDDLSFEEHETEYKYIKALLEGGLKAKPSNVVVYATSNRRHLIREVVSDRSSVGFHYNDHNEISPTDSMQEKLSLSDRFGITLTFTAPNQRDYLEMVQAIARSRKLEIGDEDLRKMALQWEKRFNGRSGRTARQFIDDLEGKILSSSKYSF